jgi:hypothetical protein
MKPPLPRILGDVPRTLHAQLEIAKAIRTLVGPDEHELARQRRGEIAALRRDIEALAADILRAFEEASALVKAELAAALRKYSPDQPRVPSGNRDGGQWTREQGASGAPSTSSDVGAAKPGDRSRPRLQYASLESGTLSDLTESARPAHDTGGKVGTSSAPNLQYAANGAFPPPLPGYDPKTWKDGQWPNGRYWVESPNGRKFTAHPEDNFHWRHWDIGEGDDGDGFGGQDRWPENSLKPRANQKRLRSEQSVTDPNEDAPPWAPNPLVPIVPEPVLPLRPIPVEPLFELPAILFPG